jgi:hypothetical protein
MEFYLFRKMGKNSGGLQAGKVAFASKKQIGPLYAGLVFIILFQRK